MKCPGMRQSRTGEAGAAMLGGRERRHRAGSATAAMALGSYYRIVMMVSFGNGADLVDCASLAMPASFHVACGEREGSGRPILARHTSALLPS